MAYIDNWDQVEKELHGFGIEECKNWFEDGIPGAEFTFDTRGPSIQGKVRWVIYSLLHHIGVKEFYKVKSLPGKITVLMPGGKIMKSIHVVKIFSPASSKVRKGFVCPVESIMPTEESIKHDENLMRILNQQDGDL